MPVQRGRFLGTLEEPRVSWADELASFTAAIQKAQRTRSENELVSRLLQTKSPEEARAMVGEYFSRERPTGLAGLANLFNPAGTYTGEPSPMVRGLAGAGLERLFREPEPEEYPGFSVGERHKARRVKAGLAPRAAQPAAEKYPGFTAEEKARARRIDAGFEPRAGREKGEKPRVVTPAEYSKAFVRYVPTRVTSDGYVEPDWAGMTPTQRKKAHRQTRRYFRRAGFTVPPGIEQQLQETIGPEEIVDEYIREGGDRNDERAFMEWRRKKGY